jgi:hypothetical protein
MTTRPRRAEEGTQPSAGAPDQARVTPADEPPPFLGRWSRVYALVVLELIAVIALCGWLSRRH